MIDLLDVNVLLSLAWPNHVHHAAALRWFRGRTEPDWATTPFTETAFIRLSANPSVIPDAVTPSEALDLLGRMRVVAGHRFLSDDVELVWGDRVNGWQVATHGQVTDAHLVAVARRHGARLATFDRMLGTLAETGSVVLVPFR